jgi:hypothetical protein
MIVVNPWHRCYILNPGNKYVAKIPKKKGEFSTMDDDATAVWFGIEADYKVSFWRLITYHVASIIAAMVFWGWWLSAHVGDFQNAAVPLAAVIALIGVFWLIFDKRVLRR